MLNIKMIFLLSLAAYVACGGSRDPPTLEGHSDDGNDNRPSDLSEPLNGTPAKSLGGDNSGCGEPSGLQNEDNRISIKDNDEVKEKEIVVDAEEEDDDDEIFYQLFIDATRESHISAELQEVEEVYNDVEEEEGDEDDNVLDDLVEVLTMFFDMMGIFTALVLKAVRLGF